MTLRQEKVSELVLQKTAEFIQRESGPQSLITVTRCDIAPTMRQSTIYITVLPESKEQDVLFFLKRKLPEMREYLKKNMRSKTVPFLDVEIDTGEKNRQRIDEISRKA